MSDEASVWLQYARENLQVAQMTLASANGVGDWPVRRSSGRSVIGT
jgi:hypothetical protein